MRFSVKVAILAVMAVCLSAGAALAAASGDITGVSNNGSSLNNIIAIDRGEDGRITGTLNKFADITSADMTLFFKLLFDAGAETRSTVSADVSKAHALTNGGSVGFSVNPTDPMDGDPTSRDISIIVRSYDLSLGEISFEKLGAAYGVGAEYCDSADVALEIKPLTLGTGTYELLKGGSQDIVLLAPATVTGAMSVEPDAFSDMADVRLKTGLSTQGNDALFLELSVDKSVYSDGDELKFNVTLPGQGVTHNGARVIGPARPVTSEVIVTLRNDANEKYLFSALSTYTLGSDKSIDLTAFNVLAQEIEGFTLGDYILKSADYVLSEDVPNTKISIGPDAITQAALESGLAPAGGRMVISAALSGHDPITASIRILPASPVDEFTPDQFDMRDALLVMNQIFGNIAYDTTADPYDYMVPAKATAVTRLSLHDAGVTETPGDSLQTVGGIYISQDVSPDIFVERGVSPPPMNVLVLRRGILVTASDTPEGPIRVVKRFVSGDPDSDHPFPEGNSVVRGGTNAAEISVPIIVIDDSYEGAAARGMTFDAVYEEGGAAMAIVTAGSGANAARAVVIWDGAANNLATDPILLQCEPAGKHSGTCGAGAAAFVGALGLLALRKRYRARHAAR